MTPRRIGIAGAVVGVLVLLYVVAVLAMGDGVRAGTSVAGIEIGGLSRAEAVATLEKGLGKRANRPLEVTAGDQDFSIDPKDAGLTFDAEATVEGVSGRTWNPVALAAALFSTRDVDPVVAVDDEALTSQVESIAVAVDTAPVEPSITMKGLEPKLKKGKPGRVLDAEATKQAIAAAYLQPREPIQAPFVTAEPTVTADAAQSALDLARSAVAEPVIVSAQDIVATLRPPAIAKALTFTAQDGALVPQLDGAVLHESIADDLVAVETPGRDARFKIVNDKPVVVPSRVGNGISDDELAAAVLPILGNRTPDRAVSVSIGVREPELTTEAAEQLCITERMSSFTQKFPYAAYRSQNIGQAAEYVDGTILKPGETFSMNDTVKERTKENGYTEGFIIAPGGVFAEEMGGGVSAAATTVWTGAFFAGLERVFTQAHSIYISRYQPGLEATVSWGNFDMSFRNDTPCGVLLTTRMTPTSMTVDFWGTKQFDDIDAEFGPRRDVTEFATVYDTSDTCLGQQGVNGFSIDVDRVFIKGGEEVKRERITTRYKATPKVVCGPKKKKDKGKGKADASPSGSPSASPSAADAQATGDGQATGGKATTSPSPEPTGKKKKPKPSPSVVADAPDAAQ